MKGLLKNNFFAVFASAGVFVIFMCFVGIFAVSAGSIYFLTDVLFIDIMGLSIIATVSLNSENSSKWGKYKITLPVSRSNIIKSLFLNHIFWICIGVILCVAEILLSLSWILHDYSSAELAGILDMCVLSVSIGLLIGAVFFPLYYVLGEEKGIVILIISTLCAFGIDAVVYNVISEVIKDVISRSAILTAFSLLVFLLSYPITKHIFMKKEY